MRPAANHYDPIDMINDWDSKGVTIWKTILSVFRGVGVNGFEGVGCGVGLGDGWRMVCRVNRK